MRVAQNMQVENLPPASRPRPSLVGSPISAAALSSIDSSVAASEGGFHAVAPTTPPSSLPTSSSSVNQAVDCAEYERVQNVTQQISASLGGRPVAMLATPDVDPVHVNQMMGTKMSPGQGLAQGLAQHDPTHHDRPGAPGFFIKTSAQHPHTTAAPPPSTTMTVLVVWQEPKICMELDANCCCACWCPCLNVKEIIENASGMAPSDWYSTLAILVVLQHLCKIIACDSEQLPWIVPAVLGGVHLLCRVMEAYYEARWKNAVGKHINAHENKASRGSSANFWRDVCCFCCCSCFMITAVGRTVDDWKTMKSEAAGDSTH